MTGHAIAAYALLAGLAMLLAVAVVSDLRHRLIYNWTNLAIAAGAPLFWLARSEPFLWNWPIHLAVAAVTFILFAIAYRIGMMGGGDVKLFTAMALWFDLVTVVQMIFVASLLGGVVTVITFADHKLRKREGEVEVPYGVAIALAGLGTIGTFFAQRYLNHFG